MKRITLDEIMPLIEAHIKNGGALMQGNFADSCREIDCRCPITLLNDKIAKNDLDDLGPINLAEQKGYDQNYLWSFIFGFDEVSDKGGLGYQDGKAVLKECLKRGYRVLDRYGDDIVNK